MSDAHRTSTYAGERDRLWQILSDQSRIIGALMMREIYTRFGRDNIGFLWVLMEPLMFCGGVIVMWSIIGHGDHQGAPLVPFLMTGYLPLLAYRHCIMRCLRCMQGNASLLYHRPLNILSMYVARMVVEMLGAIAAYVVCLVIFATFNVAELPRNLPLVLAGWSYYLWYTFGIALIVGGLSERSEVVEKIWHPLSYILIPASGTFYMVDWLPSGFQDAVLYIPQVNAVEMIRAGQFGTDVTTHFDAAYLTWFCGVLTAFGLLALKDIRRHVEVE